MVPRVKILSVMLFAALCSGCNDPELSRKLDEQQREITELSNQLTINRQKLKIRPTDRGNQLMEAERELSDLQRQTEQFEAEVVSLRERKQSLEKEFAEYRVKYPIK